MREVLGAHYGDKTVGMGGVFKVIQGKLKVTILNILRAVEAKGKAHASPRSMICMNIHDASIVYCMFIHYNKPMHT